MAQTNKLNSTPVVLTQGIGKSAMVLAALLSSTSLVQATDATTLPQGGVVSSGGATFDYSATQPHLDVNQTSQNAVIDWNSFNIGQQASTRFNQINSSSIAVNRVHDVNPSEILGHLSANGQVVVLNPNGVFFGQNAHVDVAGLLVSTGEMDVDSFNSNGTIKLSGINAKQGRITNKGTISVQDGGIAAFVAPEVVNDGIIMARLGRVAMAAGADKATVDLYGDGLVELALDSKASKALIENNGHISADGGTVAITAAAAKDIANSVVNMGGVIEANSVGVKNGKIILGATNADINLKGQINAKGVGHSNGGTVKADTNKNLVMHDTALINVDADTQGNGGNVRLWADDYALMFGTVTARGGSDNGDGGFVELSAANSVAYAGFVDTMANNGLYGRFLIDPKKINIGYFSTLTTLGDVLADALLGGTLGLMRVDAQALANTLRTSNVDLWATDSINTVGAADIDLSTWQGLFGAKGITNNNLTLSADTINLNNNVILGKGGFYLSDFAAGKPAVGYALVNLPTAIEVKTLNLNAKVLSRQVVNGVLTTASNAKIDGVADVVNVLSNNAFVQQGIEFAGAGGQVNVAAGTYTEQLEIAKNLTLKGASQAGTIIQAPTMPLTNSFVTNGSDNKSVVFVHDADQVTIKDLTVDGAGQANNNNRFVGVGYFNAGGEIKNVAVKNIINTPFNGAQGGNAIYAYNLDGTPRTLNVTGVTISNFQKNGITFSGAGLSGRITGSTVTGKGATTVIAQNGIQVSYGANAEIDHNTISAIGYTPSEWAASSVLVFDAGSNVNIHDNTVTGTGSDIGIAVVSTENIKIKNNTLNGSQFGISIDGGNYEPYTSWGVVGTSDNAQIEGNTIKATTTGIDLYDAALAIVKSNIITGSVTGINVDVSNNIIVTKNTIDKTSGDAMHVTSSNNTLIGGVLAADANTIKAAGGHGIFIKDSTDADIKNNKILGGNATSTANGAAGAVLDAIHAENAADVDIANNTIMGGNGRNAISGTARAGGAGAGGNAIYVDGSDNAQVSYNTIQGGSIGTRGAGGKGTIGNGINVSNSPAAYVGYNNLISGLLTQSAGQDGIKFTNNDGLPTNALVEFNNINNIGANGVNVADTNKVQIKNNNVYGAGAAGIIVNGSNKANMANNLVGKLLGFIGSNGIDVNDSGNATIDNNKVAFVGGNGIDVRNSNKAEMTNNNVSSVAGDGIKLTASEDATISQNIVGKLTGLVGKDGINVDNSRAVNINNNQVAYVADDGVDVNDSRGANIELNVIHSVLSNGIEVSQSKGATIKGNTIGKLSGPIGNHGIDVTDSNNVTVDANKTTLTASNGIDVRSSNNANITHNIVTLAGANGIFVDPASNIDISNNDVSFVAGSGIYADDILGLTVQDNTIKASGIHGIKVQNSDLFLISGNTVKGSVLDGINVAQSGFGLVGLNDISLSGDDGIDLTDANLVAIGLNKINGSLDNGIEVNSAQDVAVALNLITLSGQNAIQVNDSNNYVIGLNALALTGKNGIEINNSDNGLVIANAIVGAGQHGVALNKAHDTTVRDNLIAYVGQDGVHAQNSKDLLIDNNIITQAGDDGVNVRDSKRVTISDNKISDVDGDGVRANDVSKLNIHGNDVRRTGQDGIDVSASDNADILDNVVHNTGGHGIKVADSVGANIRRNLVRNTSDDGIHLNDAEDAVVRNNDIAKTDGDGISVAHSDGATIDKNDIAKTGGHGVRAQGVSDLSVTNNTITDTTKDGIHLINGYNVDITDNNISLSGDDGIDIDNNSEIFIEGPALANDINILRNVITTTKNNGVIVANSQTVAINNNDIKDTGLHGVALDNSHDVNVLRNNIGLADSEAALGFVAGNGIDTNSSYDLNIANNIITNIGQDGIHVDGGYNMDITDNNISLSGDDGIDVRNAGQIDELEESEENAAEPTLLANSIRILRNLISSITNDGVRVANSQAVAINNNNIQDVGQHGIDVSNGFVVDILNNQIGADAVVLEAAGDEPILPTMIGSDGIHISDSNDVLVDNNIITADVLGNGIAVYGSHDSESSFTVPSTDITISRNNISGVGQNGIYLQIVDDVNLSDNTLTNSGNFGVYAAGDYNGDIALSGNIINSLDGHTGGAFESGNIDFTGNSNIINGGADGLLFNGFSVAPVSQEGFFAKIFASGPTGLSLVNNSFGTTVFNGQTGNYIVLQNGAFFNPGTPTILDATQVSFDGYIPGGGIIPAFNYFAIQNKIVDYNDLASLGLIFFGTSDNLDQNELLPEEKLLASASSRVPLLTITGLPYAPGTNGQIPASVLNALATSSGGGNLASMLNGISTAAGGDGNGQQMALADMLNDIDTSAGGTTASCWNQVYSSFSGNNTTPVNYSFDSNPINQIATQAGCGI